MAGQRLSHQPIQNLLDTRTDCFSSFQSEDYNSTRHTEKKKKKTHQFISTPLDGAYSIIEC